MSQRILVVAHNHPTFHPGGTEIVAYDLFQAYKRAGREALFLAATNQVHREPRPGTSLQTVGDAADEVVLWAGHFDRLMMSQIDLHGVIPDLVRLLEEFRPDVVEIHHLAADRHRIPGPRAPRAAEARIVMMLHDYYPICAHDGLMVRPHDRGRCLNRLLGQLPSVLSGDAGRDVFPAQAQPSKPSLARRCLHKPEPFPQGALRRMGPRSPTDGGRFPTAIPLASRWRSAMPAEVRVTSSAFSATSTDGRARWSCSKRAGCLRKAASHFEMRVHGAPLFQGAGIPGRTRSRLCGTRACVRRMGQYARSDIPHLMSSLDWVVVPSMWWENAPLTIGEAQFHARPVIASGIGGMAELVRDGDNGLHVRPDDPIDLARVMTRACQELGLWRRLSAASLPPPLNRPVAACHIAMFAGARPSAPALAAA